MTFSFDKVGNMVFMSCGDQVWKAWDASEFTARKMNNAKKNILNSIPTAKFNDYRF